MSTAPITHSPDIRRLVSDGYDIQVVNGVLIVHNVPYLDNTSSPQFGILFSALDSDGGNTAYHSGSDHTVLFAGGYPHDASARPLASIRNSSDRVEVLPGIWADHRFSARPQNNYHDYHEKMTAYIKLLGQPVIEKGYQLNARPYRRIRSRGSPHRYDDTNSARANITAINDRLVGQKIAIIGMGGTGSYILDLVAKTNVGYIHIYDGDSLLLHNAFRAPGAITRERLQSKPNKALYHKLVYSRIHKHIVAHPIFITPDRFHELDDIDFAFISMDGGSPSSELGNYLNLHSIPYVDVGMGIRIVDSKLHGQIRTSLRLPKDGCLSVSELGKPDDAYRSNIQVAELNALNSSLAVIAWKRYYGIYPVVSNMEDSVFNLRTGGLV